MAFFRFSQMLFTERNERSIVEAFGFFQLLLDWSLALNFLVAERNERGLDDSLADLRSPIKCLNGRFGPTRLLLMLISLQVVQSILDDFKKSLHFSFLMQSRFLNLVALRVDGTKHLILDLPYRLGQPFLGLNQLMVIWHAMILFFLPSEAHPLLLCKVFGILSLELLCQLM